MFDPDWDSNDLFRQLCEERALADVLKLTIDKVNELLTAERALADDLANVLDYILHAENGEGERVLARWRETRGR
jgi:hypothetical protein